MVPVDFEVIHQSSMWTQNCTTAENEAASNLLLNGDCEIGEGNV
jgi:hypothetical protein